MESSPLAAKAGYDGSRIPREVYIVISIFIVLIFATIGLSGSPEAASVTMWILLAGYLVLAAFGEYVNISWLIVIAMASLHAGAILSYYSHPLILPFVIIERSKNYSSLNIDFIQIIIIVEIIRQMVGEKTIKAAQGIQEQGAGGEPR